MSNVRALRATPVAITFFDPADGDTAATFGLRLDANVMCALEERFGSIDTLVRSMGSLPDADLPALLLACADAEPIVATAVEMLVDECQRLRLLAGTVPVRKWSTLRAVFATAFGWSDAEAGSRMIPTEMGNYLIGFYEAFGIANGVDPQTAARMARSTDVVSALNSAVENATPGVPDDVPAEAIPNLDRSGTTGTAGSERGRVPAEPSTSSGG